jgi:hypothetical protein
MTPERIACLAFHFICGIPPGGLFRLPVLTCFLWWCQLERSLGFLSLYLLLLRIFIRVVDLLTPFIFPAFYYFLPKDLHEEAIDG